MANKIRIPRRAKVGFQMADAIIEMVHMMYQKQTARVLLGSMIARLRQRLKEFD